MSTKKKPSNDYRTMPIEDIAEMFQTPLSPKKRSKISGGTPVAPKDPVERETEKRDNNFLKAEYARMVEMLRVEREKNAFLTEVDAHKATPKIIRSEKTSGLREMTSFAMGSDWHVEEEVEAVKVGFRNEYNLKIADDSVRRFFQAQVDLVEHHRASKQVVIRDHILALTGDLMTGFIHEEMRETNQLSPIETCIWLKGRLINGITTLLTKLQLRSLIIPFSFGNHGRTTDKTRITMGAENSFEWLLGRMLEDEFSDDPRVKFDTSPRIHQYAEVYDFTIHTTHGDSLRFGGGVGGLGIPLLKRVPQWDSERFAHWHGIGHFHQQRNYGRAFTNGSLIGWNSFASFIGASFEEPQQTFFLIDSKRGLCHNTPLWVRPDRAGVKKKTATLSA